MSAAVLERPAIAPKKITQASTPAATSELKADTEKPPNLPPSFETSSAISDAFHERLLVAMSIVSVCMNMTGGDHESDCKKIPELVCLGMEHVEGLLAEVEDMLGCHTTPSFDYHLYRASALVEMFNGFCISGGSEFKFCDDITNSMLWGIRTALEKLDAMNSAPTSDTGEAA